VVIKLTNKQLQSAKILASIRSSQKQYLDSKEVRTSANPPSYERHYLGIRGELAVATFFNTLIDEKFCWGDGNVGDVYVNKKSIQVKTKGKSTRDRIFRLRTDDPKEFRCDYGILCVEESEDTINIYSFFTREMFLEKYSLEQTMYGDKVSLNPQYQQLFTTQSLPEELKTINTFNTQELSFILEPILSIEETLRSHSTKETMDKKDMFLLLEFLKESVETVHQRMGGFSEEISY
jgi:hypothetical protein